MQLIIITIAIFLMVATHEVRAQIQGKRLSDRDNNDDTQARRVELDTSIYPTTEKQKPIEVDFLASYYEQDGNNSAVEGGEGTEFLTDFTSKIIVKIPVGQKYSVNADAGFDYYTSASTDRIDQRTSTPSRTDTRVHGNIGLSYDLSEQQSIGLRIGGSGEYDYTSFSMGMDYSILSEDKNSSLAFSAQAFIDNWKLFSPRGNVIETNEQALNGKTARQSYNASLSLSQVLNKRMQASLQLEAVYMNGILSTPFHRVFFADLPQGQDVARIEILPGNRLKLPLGLRFNYHALENLIVRTYYRFYWDDWGMQAHTASVELPVKINRFFSVYPFYRFHTQTAADYFLPKGEHLLANEFYTSDYDLSELHSHSAGLGVKWSPAAGVFRAKLPSGKRILVMDGIDLRYAYYDRSTDLTAHIVSIGLGFKF